MPRQNQNIAAEGVSMCIRRDVWMTLKQMQMDFIKDELLPPAATMSDVIQVLISNTQADAAADGDSGEPVAAAAACPNCGERRQDKLVWQNDEDEQIQCATCGMVYRLDA